MLIRDLQEAYGTDAEVDDGQWVSTRLILRSDGMGHSVHETIIRPGAELHMWYRNHVETVFCIEGVGEIEDLSEGGKWALHPGKLYALNNHQKHILRSEKGMRTLCVFTPPLVGKETHDEEGSYPLLDRHGNVIKH